MIVAVGFFALRPRPEPEPSVNGRRLSEWVHDLGQGVSTEEKRQLASKSIKSLGTNSIPYLVKWISYDSPTWLYYLNRACNGITYPLFNKTVGWGGTQTTLAHGATKAFWCLGSDAELAVGDLTKLLHSPNADRAAEALSVVGKKGLPPLVTALRSTDSRQREAALTAIYRVSAGLGTNGAPAVPALLDCLHDRNERIVNLAAGSLGSLRTSPELVVPALTNALSRTTGVVHLGVIYALGKVGTNAQGAVPALVPILSHPNLASRSATTNALFDIAPELLPTDVRQAISNTPTWLRLP